MTNEEFNEVWQLFLHGTEDERRSAFNSICNECWAGLEVQAGGILNRYFRSDNYRYIAKRDIVHNVLLVLRDKEPARIERINSLDGLRGYLYRILENVCNNEYRRLAKDGEPMPNYDNVEGEDLGQNYYGSLSGEAGNLFRGYDQGILGEFAEIFHGVFKRNHELCYYLIIAHYVDDISYGDLIEENRFPQYDKASALMQIAHRNKQELRNLL